MRRRSGQSMVEFALVAPVTFLILLTLFDMLRAAELNNTVAEAAREGARQAIANASTSDSPFGSSNGQPCQGTAFTTSASGTGCLTDSRIFATVKTVLGNSVSGSTLYSATLASACPTPAAGYASVCIAPAEEGSAGSYSSCAAAKSALGRDPAAGDLGAREPEWANPQYVGCFYVEVSVVVRFQPVTPLASEVFPSLMKISSTTSMLAEY